MHVDIQAVAVSGGETMRRDRPIGFQIFVITAVKGVSALFLNQVKGAGCVFQSFWLTGCQGILREGINRKGLSVNQLIFHQWAAILLNLPEPAAVLLIP